jgi:glycosyltransferase involved in cell wall biosynthesis
MISVLIPVYNYDVSFLVNCLSQVFDNSEILDEIIIGSDGCDESFIKSYKYLQKIKGVDLFISDENIGRAAIRNRLAEKATGEFLLFIDADASIEGNALPFFSRYAEATKLAPVLCGGVSYKSIPPDDPDRFLRWNYGFHREQRSARTRNKHPYSSFSGFNFMVAREVFLKLRFNEDLVKYGHEDTLFGYQLNKAGIKVYHIDNPLVHEGIESNRDFLLKTKEGVHNLSLLYGMVTDKSTFRKSVRLVALYSLLKRIGISYLISKVYTKNRRRIEISLRRRHSNLFLFSMYKLSLFCYFMSGGKLS